MGYSTNFQTAILVVLRHEGGYVNDPTDRGGETKYGISKRSYPNVDIKALTVESATAIYHKDWWLPGPYELIVDTKLATKVFDTAINMGAKRAYRFLQEAANACGGKLIVDGIIGKNSIKAINSLDSTAILNAFRTRQEKYYLDLIKARPSQVKYKNGWLNRARS